MKRRIGAAVAATAAVMAGALAPVAPAAATAASEQRTVTVDLDEVLQEDYLGIGVNVIPWSLMPGTTTRGYDDADWEVDVERILTLQPKVVRLWFQIDWMEQEKGVYDFDSDRMKAFYRYLDAFKQAGTEVELNFGWKVGQSVHDWFLYPGVAKPYESAPGDLVAYGRSASALLNELINVRGYDNVDYLTFYNEPNGSWDFEGPVDQKAYYAAMARQVHEQLIEDGLRDDVEIWGPEEVNAPDWTQYMAQNAADVFDQYSFHLYGESYDLMAQAIDQRRGYIGDAPLNLSEMGWTNPGTSVWETGYANYIIRSANNDVHSNLIWQLNGVMTDDPAGDTNGSYNLWDSLVLGLEPTAAFYEAGLLMRYVPEHSTVLGTTVSDDDIRATAFRDADGELTVLVETQDGSAKDVRVEFTGGEVSGDFHRFAFSDSQVHIDANALLPASTGTLTASGNAFTDDAIGEENTFAIYTTAEPATQVAVDPVQSDVTGGEQTTLHAEIIDGPADAEVTWSVVGEGNGSISADGVFTAPEVETERTVAIRATVGDGVYGVAQVLVLPASRAGVVDAPVFSLAPGVYDSVEAVRITSGTAGAEIRYTTDGSVPTASSTLYTGQILLNPLQTVYLRAIAISDGLHDSGVTSRLYKVRGIQNAPDGYVFCQYEGEGECAFEGEASVAFGSDGLFSYGTFTDGVDCSAASFPENPNPGSDDNRCFFSTDIPETPPVVTIYNAGFESPATGGTANGPMVNGWTFSARSGIQHNNSVFRPASPAPQGERTAYLKTDSGLGSRIDQTVVFPEGRYALTFYGAVRTDFGGKQEWDVLIDDTVLGHYAPAGGTYEFYESDAIDLTAGEHTISFVATTTTGDNTGFIDDVKVVKIDEETPDQVKPSTTLVTPTSAGPHAALALQVDATDDRGLDRIVANIYRDGILVKSTQTAVGGATTGTHTATVAVPDGAYTIRYNARDTAGNISQTKTFAVTVDATPPTVTPKEGDTFTTSAGDAYDQVSFKLYDAGKIDKLTLNGVTKDLSDNAWSDLNFVKPGVFGAVAGANRLVVYDLAGNSKTVDFVLR
ncbi:chitobiase/beta-hexosaminidase C-terminal domain-containing protein [Microbacterium sp. XT11]|uniref:chitobiase/beta-hexosaminidase C-terminal domain-containing protein n=1 Tax=Microbacterium sp. XT11 TaxID=367477 RepID=UPI0008377BA2|nr:chitobiase/beta-hexosaminidase C-terminal domain-containing protein [Microbacterium sp. XT11]